MRTSRKLQKRHNFQDLHIGSAKVPDIDYNTFLSATESTLKDIWSYGFPVDEDIYYCNNRIYSDKQPHFPYASAYSGIPPFSSQFAIKFGEDTPEAELNRKKYFLKYYLTYKRGILNSYSGSSGLYPVPSGYSVYNQCNMTDEELEQWMETIHNSFIDSLNPIEKEDFNYLDLFSKDRLYDVQVLNDLPFPTLSSNGKYTPEVDTLDEFEREYQEFINSLKRQKELNENNCSGTD